MPIQAIVTPIEMVIQKGPKLDLLYLCLMSEYAKKREAAILKRHDNIFKAGTEN